MSKGVKGKGSKAKGKGAASNRRKLTPPQRVTRESDDDESSGNINESGASGQVTWGWNSGFSTGFLGHFQI